MSHDCVYLDGECGQCADEAAAEYKRLVLSQRGRWLVVHEDGTAYRLESLSGARRQVRQLWHWVGDRAHVIRYRRERVWYAGGCLEVTDARWLP